MTPEHQTALDALLFLEWAVDDYGTVLCPACRSREGEGHRARCKTNAALTLNDLPTQKARDIARARIYARDLVREVKEQRGG